MRSAIVVAAFLAGLLIGVGLSGRAETWGVLSGLAVHLDGARHCNSFTAGVGLEHHIASNVRLAIGVYDNSNCHASAYLAAAWMPLSAGAFHLGLIGGAVTGYRETITPAGGPVLSYEGRRWGANAILIPPTGESGGGVLWLQAKVRF